MYYNIKKAGLERRKGHEALCTACHYNSDAIRRPSMGIYTIDIMHTLTDELTVELTNIEQK